MRADCTLQSSPCLLQSDALHMLSHKSSRGCAHSFHGASNGPSLLEVGQFPTVSLSSTHFGQGQRTMGPFPLVCEEQAGWMQLWTGPSRHTCCDGQQWGRTCVRFCLRHTSAFLVLWQNRTPSRGGRSQLEHSAGLSSAAFAPTTRAQAVNLGYLFGNKRPLQKSTNTVGRANPLNSTQGNHSYSLCRGAQEYIHRHLLLYRASRWGRCP